MKTVKQLWLKLMNINFPIQSRVHAHIHAFGCTALCTVLKSQTVRYRTETQQGNEGNPLWEALLCRYWIASYCSSPPGSAAPQPCSPDKSHFLSKGVWDYSEMALGIVAECKCMWAHVRRTSSRLCTGLQKFAIKFIFLTYLPPYNCFRFKARYLQTDTLDN